MSQRKINKLLRELCKVTTEAQYLKLLIDSSKLHSALERERWVELNGRRAEIREHLRQLGHETVEL